MKKRASDACTFLPCFDLNFDVEFDFVARWKSLCTQRSSHPFATRKQATKLKARLDNINVEIYVKSDARAKVGRRTFLRLFCSVQELQLCFLRGHCLCATNEACFAWDANSAHACDFLLRNAKSQQISARANFASALFCADLQVICRCSKCLQVDDAIKYVKQILRRVWVSAKLRRLVKLRLVHASLRGATSARRSRRKTTSSWQPKRILHNKQIEIHNSCYLSPNSQRNKRRLLFAAQRKMDCRDNNSHFILRWRKPEVVCATESVASLNVAQEETQTSAACKALRGLWRMSRDFCATSNSRLGRAKPQLNRKSARKAGARRGQNLIPALCKSNRARIVCFCFRWTLQKSVSLANKSSMIWFAAAAIRAQFLSSRATKRKLRPIQEQFASKSAHSTDFGPPQGSKSLTSATNERSFFFFFISVSACNATFRNIGSQTKEAAKKALFVASVISILLCLLVRTKARQSKTVRFCLVFFAKLVCGAYFHFAVRAPNLRRDFSSLLLDFAAAAINESRLLLCNLNSKRWTHKLDTCGQYIIRRRDLCVNGISSADELHCSASASEVRETLALSRWACFASDVAL